MDIVNLFARKKAENPSLPGGKVVRGHLIPRLPLGEYLAALQALQKAFASVLPSINLCSQEEFASFVSKIRVALNK